MKKNMQRISYLLIGLNTLITISSIILLISLVNKINKNSAIWNIAFNASLFTTVLIFMFIFAIGMINLFTYKHTSINKLLIIGVLNIIPLPLLSIINVIMVVLFLMNIDDELGQINNNKNTKIEIKNNVQNSVN